MSLVRIAAAMLILLSLALPAWAQDITFSGEVTYRERIALPQGARLVVTLVNLDTGASIVSARSSLAGNGQVPVQFTLNVRSNVIKSGGAFGLTAELQAAGARLFRTPQPFAVDPTDPGYTRLLLVHAPAVLPAAAAPEGSLDQDLIETVWTVTSIGGEPVMTDTSLTFSIAADRRAGGSGGCNNYFTEASFDKTELTFGPVAGTRMACAPETMAQEARFFAALSATHAYEIAGNGLKLMDAAGIPLAGLVRNTP